MKHETPQQPNHSSSNHRQQHQQRQLFFMRQIIRVPLAASKSKIVRRLLCCIFLFLFFRLSFFFSLYFFSLPLHLFAIWLQRTTMLPAAAICGPQSAAICCGPLGGRPKKKPRKKQNAGRVWPLACWKAKGKGKSAAARQVQLKCRQDSTQIDDVYKVFWFPKGMCNYFLIFL